MTQDTREAVEWATDYCSTRHICCSTQGETDWSRRASALRTILSALATRDAELAALSADMDRTRASLAEAEAAADRAEALAAERLKKPSAEMIRAVEFAIYRYSDCSARDAERGAPHVIRAVAATLTKGASDAR